MTSWWLVVSFFLIFTNMWGRFPIFSQYFSDGWGKTTNQITTLQPKDLLGELSHEKTPLTFHEILVI